MSEITPGFGDTSYPQFYLPMDATKIGIKPELQRELKESFIRDKESEFKADFANPLTYYIWPDDDEYEATLTWLRSAQRDWFCNGTRTPTETLPGLANGMVANGNHTRELGIRHFYKHGQHTFWPMVRIVVGTRRDAARYFVEAQGRPVGNTDKFWVEYEADETGRSRARRIVAAAKRAQVWISHREERRSRKLDPTNTKGWPQTQAIAALLNVYGPLDGERSTTNRFGTGEKLVFEVLQLIRQTWGSTADAYLSHVIEGVGVFLKIHGQNRTYRSEIFVEQLRNLQPKVLKTITDDWKIKDGRGNSSQNATRNYMAMTLTWFYNQSDEVHSPLVIQGLRDKPGADIPLPPSLQRPIQIHIRA